MKTYPITDLTGDQYLNPAGPESRPVGNITRIIVHHDAVVRPHDYDSVARIRAEAAGHYNSLGPGLQYHYVIDNVGEIFKVRSHERTLWHCGNLPWNRTSLAIKLDGYFHAPHNQKPTREQYEALKQLLGKLCTQHPEFPADQNDVYGHREASSTACPGDNLFPWVVGYRQTNGSIGIPDVPYDWPSLQPSAPAPSPSTPQPTPPVIEINYRVFKAGKQIGAYKVDANAWNKFKAEGGDAIKDQNGNDITAQIVAKFNPPTPPPAVPDKAPEDEKPINYGTDISDLKNRVTGLEAIVKAITDFLSNVFKNWRQ